MSDWKFLNQCRATFGPLATDESYGFNGWFRFNVKREVRPIYCIASDGGKWKHVSVSFGPKNFKTPSWDVMCAVRHLFFEPDEWVVQFHPPIGKNINQHAGCLHLWCWKGGEFPTPPPEFVGVVGWTKGEIDKIAKNEGN